MIPTVSHSRKGKSVAMIKISLVTKGLEEFEGWIGET